MDYSNEILIGRSFHKFQNGKDIHLYDNQLKTKYILSEYEKKLPSLDDKINLDQININQDFKIRNRTINIKSENDFIYNTKYFQTLNKINENIENNNISKKDNICNNNINNIIKKININEPNGITNITKSEPNLYKNRNSINNTISKINNNKLDKLDEDFGNISEIKKSDLSFEEQNINPEFNIDYCNKEKNDKFNNNIINPINNIYNKLNYTKEGFIGKKNEKQKIMNEYPEIINNKIYKNFSDYQILKNENILLKKEIKKLNIEIKEKNDLIDEFTELVKQSKIKFEKLMLKNKIKIEEIENNNINKIAQLSATIKKLEYENNILTQKNKNLINNLNKYQKYTKSIEQKISNTQRKTYNINKFNISPNMNNIKSQNLITTRDKSNIILNTRIDRRQHNHSCLFEKNEKNIHNIVTKFTNYTSTLQKNRNSNINKENLDRNSISKIEVESNLRKNKALFRDLSANIEKRMNREIIRRKGNSFRIMNTLNGFGYNSESININ